MQECTINFYRLRYNAVQEDLEPRQQGSQNRLARTGNMDGTILPRIVKHSLSKSVDSLHPYLMSSQERTSFRGDGLGLLSPLRRQQRLLLLFLLDFHRLRLHIAHDQVLLVLDRLRVRNLKDQSIV